WEEGQEIAAAEVGRKIAEEPPVAVAKLRLSTFGCDWLLDRWELLGNALFSAEDEDGPGCTWTDADVALALDLLGRAGELRHLGTWVGRLLALRERANSGSEEAVAELRALVADQVAALERKRAEVWEGVEKPRLLLWQAGVATEFGPEVQRLHRYEA